MPDVHADIVILCSPSNPTGAVMTREDLREWVDYALREKSLIIFDSAYEAFVRNPSLPRSIYEIEGAEKVAIEIRSFSKTAGFTGLRCGYTVVPKALTGTDASGREVSLGNSGTGGNAPNSTEPAMWFSAAPRRFIPRRDGNR